MGVVIDFPRGCAGYREQSGEKTGRGCDVVILPVIRIDRYEDKPLLQSCEKRGAERRKNRASPFPG
jgi:hypothetical protein